MFTNNIIQNIIYLIHKYSVYKNVTYLIHKLVVSFGDVFKHIKHSCRKLR